jgi:hypothetical protein
LTRQGIVRPSLDGHHDCHHQDKTTEAFMPTAAKILGSSPGGTTGEKAKTAFYRALRTLIQGLAAAFPAAGTGVAILSTGYWHTFAYACLAALITAIVSFLQNIATILPEDPTQTS